MSDQALLEELSASCEGRPELAALLPEVYAELKRAAHHQLNWKADQASLNTTALVNETYLALQEQNDRNWRNRQHFLAVASILMRRVVMRHAEARRAEKRGHEKVHLSVDDVEVAAVHWDHDTLLDLDRLLDGLAGISPRAARVVECRFFAGMSNAETAQLLGVSEPTIKRDWVLAQAWLKRALQEAQPPGGNPAG